MILEMDFPNDEMLIFIIKKHNNVLIGISYSPYPIVLLWWKTKKVTYRFI